MMNRLLAACKVHFSLLVAFVAGLHISSVINFVHWAFQDKRRCSEKEKENEIHAFIRKEFNNIFNLRACYGV